MTIRIYILASRDRHDCDLTITVFYTKRAMFDELIHWLLEGEEDDDIASVKAMLDNEDYAEAEKLIAELADSSGNEWSTATEAVDVTKAEPWRP